MNLRFLSLSDAGVKVRESEDGKPILFGYALKWGQKAKLFQGWYERFDKGAFREAMDDVGLKLQHGGLYLVRSTAGDFSVAEDDVGLAYEATLDREDAEHMSVYRRARRGVFGGASVGYLPKKGGTERELRKNGDIVETIKPGGVKLFPEISIVNIPAFTGSTVQVRMMEQCLSELPEDLRQRRDELLSIVQEDHSVPKHAARVRAMRARVLAAKE